jgi:hypothetical protein
LIRVAFNDRPAVLVATSDYGLDVGYRKSASSSFIRMTAGTIGLENRGHGLLPGRLSISRTSRVLRQSNTKGRGKDDYMLSGERGHKQSLKKPSS